MPDPVVGPPRAADEVCPVCNDEGLASEDSLAAGVSWVLCDDHKPRGLFYTVHIDVETARRATAGDNANSTIDAIGLVNQAHWDAMRAALDRLDADPPAPPAPGQRDPAPLVEALREINRLAAPFTPDANYLIHHKTSAVLAAWEGDREDTDGD